MRDLARNGSPVVGGFASRRQNNYDRWRDRQCHLAGWHSERVGDVDIDHHLADVVADLLQIYRDLPEHATVTAVA